MAILICGLDVNAFPGSSGWTISGKSVRGNVAPEAREAFFAAVEAAYRATASVDPTDPWDVPGGGPARMESSQPYRAECPSP